MVSLTDRRAQGNRLVRWVYQRHLETVLYGRINGSSSPIWKVMNTAGIGSTTLAVNRASITANLVTEPRQSTPNSCLSSSLPCLLTSSTRLALVEPWSHSQLY